MVVFVGKFETLDAGGKPGDGFVFAERVERPDACFAVFLFFIGVLLFADGQHVAELRHCLHAELRFEEAGAFHALVVATQRLPFDHRFEEPAPALAVVLGGVPGLGDRVEDGVPGGIDGSALLFDCCVPAIFVVGQFIEVGKRLQLPRLPAVDHRLGELAEHFGRTAFVVFILGDFHRIAVKL